MLASAAPRRPAVGHGDAKRKINVKAAELARAGKFARFMCVNDAEEVPGAARQARTRGNGKARKFD